MPLHVSISIAAKILGACTKTLRRWDAAGKFKPAFRTIGNHRRYDLAVLRKFRDLHSENPLPAPAGRGTITPRAVTYARVSSAVQKKRGDLGRQQEKLVDYCEKKGFRVVRSITDVGSGLNDSRKGLHRIIKMASRGLCDAVVVAYPDRLARFGINALKACFSEWGVTLVVLGGKEKTATREAELVGDITSILYSYMGKLYRMRRGGQKEKPAVVS